MTDLPEGALRCRHCGARTDGKGDEPALRNELAKDLDRHHGFLRDSLAQAKWGAGLIAALALGATLYFGIRTDRGITETTEAVQAASREAIERTADALRQKGEAGIAAAAIEAGARAEVQRRVEAQLAAPETRALIEEAIAGELRRAAAEEAERRGAGIRAELGAALAARRAEVAALLADIERLRLVTAGAAGTVETLGTAFAASRERRAFDAVVAVEPLRVEEKAGIEQLRRLVGDPAPVEALALEAGGYYTGPFLWKYVTLLNRRPEFRFVLILEPDGPLAGWFEPRALARLLDPQEADRPLAGFAWPDGEMPGENLVPGWDRLARRLSEGGTGYARGLPGFVPGGQAVRADGTMLAALLALAEARADRMPAVGADGRVTGVADLARLTARMVLDLTAPPLRTAPQDLLPRSGRFGPDPRSLPRLPGASGPTPRPAPAIPAPPPAFRPRAPPARGAVSAGRAHSAGARAPAAPGRGSRSPRRPAPATRRSRRRR